ncbi:hypothetical protein FOA52_001871 [Chlamydomonas sp. UWO 241]|nr:hypothetical protein FOA52_001871 [Chlamydomonas sp. UWO 241]
MEDDEDLAALVEVDQAYTLTKNQELRVECNGSGDVTVQLEDGIAEVFGAELQLGVPININGQRVAVFTWTGCTVHIRGVPADMIIYTADDTPMTSYMNTHTILNNKRAEALKAGGRGPNVIILGPTDSGKSTLSKMLCNWAARSNWEPTMVDLDIGQGSITVPGCLAATPIEVPIDVEDGYPLEMPLVYFFGHATPSDNPELYKFLVDRLAAVLEQRAEANPKAAASGLIINTLGWIDGLGYELQLHAISSMKADVVLVLEQDRLYNQVSTELRGENADRKVTVVKLNKSGGVVKRERDERKTARERRIREYFFGRLGNVLQPATQTVRADTLKVFRIGGGPRAPSSTLPIGMTSIADPMRLTNLPASAELVQSLIAVSHAPTPDQILATNVAGFVLVKDVDAARGTITYLAPCTGNLPGRYLVTGSCSPILKRASVVIWAALFSPVQSIGDHMETPQELTPGSGFGAEATQAKPRATKTPLQKEVLEASYQLNAFPSEEYRRALGVRIQLSEQQVQAWFINRRRREKRSEGTAGSPPGSAAGAAAPAMPIQGVQRVQGVQPACARPRVPPGTEEASDDEPEFDADWREVVEAAKATIPGYTPDGPPLGLYFDEPPASAGMFQGRKKIVFDKYVAEADGAGGFKGGRKRPAGALDDDGLEAVYDDEYRPSAYKKTRGEMAAEREAKKQSDREDKERQREEARKIKEMERARLANEREAKKVELQRERERKAEEKKKSMEDKKREKEMAKAVAHQDKQLTRMRQFHGGGPPDDLELEWQTLLEAAGIERGAWKDVVETTVPSQSGKPDAEGRAQLARPEFPPSSLALAPAFPPELGNELGAEVLMVWNFLFSFSDLLGFSCPTLDELLASLAHGKDCVLVPLIHITLLRMLQADMEEAHAAGAALPCGPGNFLDRALSFYANMLEEAWGWGFDIDAWRAHLAHTTWPEVLRQVAIMSGAGPKRTKIQKPNNKPKLGVEGEDIVLGDGGAMSLALPPRLSTGSVKAATWLVLAEAGPAGLPVGEIARRITRLGLRDLKATRTREASLAGAMARDVLFVRVAQSTFALGSVVTHHKALAGGGSAPPPPTKAEGAAGAGRGVQAPAPGEATVKTEGGAAAAAPVAVKVEGGAPAAAPAAPAAAAASAAAAATNGGASGSNEPAGVPVAAEGGGAAAAAAAVKPEDGGDAAAVGVKAEEEEEEEDDGEGGSEDGEHEEGAASEPVEPWIVMLLNHDYDELPLEHRLAALSFLVNLVVNGPTVRAKLDARAEEGMKLKKQLLEDVKNERKKRQVAEAAARAEAAIKAAEEKAARDAERAAEDAERALSAVGAGGSRPPGGGGDTPIRDADGRAGAAGGPPGAASSTPTGAGGGAADGGAPSASASMDAEGPGAGGSHHATPSRAVVTPAPAPGTSEGGACEEERRRRDKDEKERERVEADRLEQERLDALRKVDEDHLLRMEPVGMDRRHNRYWRFTPLAIAKDGSCDAGADAGAGRVLVQSNVDGAFRLLSTAEQIDALAASLDPRGAREMELATELKRIGDGLRVCMPAPPVVLPPRPPASEADAELVASCSRRIQADRYLPQRWHSSGEEATVLAGECSDPRCLELKSQMLRLEVALPDAAILPELFDRPAWIAHLRAASTPGDLRGCLAELEAALLPGFLVKEFVRLPAVVPGVYVTSASAGASATPAPDGASPSPAKASDGAVAASVGGKEGSAPPPVQGATCDYLSWLPPTYSAVSLRLATLDASLLYEPSSTSFVTGRTSCAGYKYALRPPVALPHHRSSAPQLHNGVTAAIFNSPMLSFGKLRQMQLMPMLPGEFMCVPPTEFTPPLEKLRASLRPKGPPRGPRAGGADDGGGGTDDMDDDHEAEEEEWTRWVDLEAPALAVGTFKPKAGAKAGGSGAAAAAASKAGAGGRSHKKGGGGGKKGGGGASKKKSAAQREAEEDEDKDYGDDYDDGMDDIIDEIKYSYNPAPKATAGHAFGDDDDE